MYSASIREFVVCQNHAIELIDDRLIKASGGNWTRDLVLTKDALYR